MLITLSIFTALAFLLWLFLALSPSRRNNFNHRLDPGPYSTQFDPLNRVPPLPRVAIICPGRNEADKICTTIPQVCSQHFDHAPNTGDNPPYRVIFVDDQSTDTTQQITAELADRFQHLQIVRNNLAPPEGWVGKCWAVHQGYFALVASEEREAGLRTVRDPKETPTRPVEWVCFTDADINWHPLCLQTALRYAIEKHADVVALFPKLQFGSTPECLTQSTMVLALGLLFPFEKAMDRDNPNTLTGGAFILVKRDMYEKIGGHESVKGCIIEDLNLGRKLKSVGATIRIAVTHDLLRCRMYDGWNDMWEGLTKNAYAGLDYKPHYLAAFLAAVLFANILPPFFLIAAIVFAVQTHGVLAVVTAALALGTLLLQAMPMNTIRKLLDLPPLYAFQTPVGSAIYSVFLVASAYRFYRGGNVWKGRRYGPSNVQTRAT
jgi:chlorobactene glucosyltransferase